MAGRRVFDQVERAALQPLPADRFAFFNEAQRSVHRDGHVEVAKAYYSVPPEYLGRRLWVRWDVRQRGVKRLRHHSIVKVKSISPAVTRGRRNHIGIAEDQVVQAERSH